ncbi:hypothetical protein pb186bvf_008954 [Paramecium bursaria]
MSKQFSLVFAMTPKGGIGYQGNLPWRLSQDLKYFKKVTTQGDQNVVVMGRKTWESIKQTPLKDRENVVISKTLKPSQQNVKIFPSLDETLKYYENQSAKLFVIGGKSLIEEGLDKCSDLHLTRVGVEVPCDVYINPNFKELNVVTTSKAYSQNNINFDFQHLSRNQPVTSSLIDQINQEQQYLDLIQKILKDGSERKERTGVGTLSLFGNTMRFDLEHTFPLLTTKKTFFKAVVLELLWFLNGDTNGKHLLEQNVKIWEGNGSKEYLTSIGIDREEHDLGPIYGFQWRHFGAKYKDFNTNYDGQGVDQIKQVIHLIKNDPTSRRIILSAWNPLDLPQMALPPCHVMAQFYINNGKLSCQMYQRSCDVGLGVPFNIASYALLTLMLAKHCDLLPGEFIHVMGDTHIYTNHIEQLQEQIRRTPYPFPVLKLPKKDSIFDYKWKDFEIIGYQSHDKIQMRMAV